MHAFAGSQTAIRDILDQALYMESELEDMKM